MLFLFFSFLFSVPDDRTLHTIVAILSFHIIPVFHDDKGGCDPYYHLGTDPIIPRAHYSLFNPTFPTVRRPQAPIPVASNISAKQVQNTALYPNKSASGEPFCTYEESFVTLADMIAKSVRPMDVPNWAMVLKTAPASPWVSGEKTSVMIKFATVKITIRHEHLLAYFDVNCHLKLFRSAWTGRRCQ
jgi:hypothetical protein